MNLADRITAFSRLGSEINNFDASTMEYICNGAASNNNWFTQESVKLSLSGIAQWLNEKDLTLWTNPYSFPTAYKKVGLVMAGNIPLVGFHDIIAVLISGHSLYMKVSSQDQFLPGFLIKKLVEIEPRFEEKIIVAENLKGMDAMIATGSDNSARYFEYYFSKIPNIIRKNRTSCAILTGEEDNYEMAALGLDVFQYYGLGCRNVSKLFVPEGYNFVPLIESWAKYENIISHHKYNNNYDYNKSIYLVNKEPHLDSGFLLFKASQELVSPIAVLYYQTYSDVVDLNQHLHAYQDKIQCIVGKAEIQKEVIAFGTAQSPALTDYADNIDTLGFLSSI